MFKKYFTVCLALLALQTVAFADEAVFSNNETEQFTLQPLNLKEVPQEAEAPSAPTQSPLPTASKPAAGELSNTNYLNAINNLDNAQVELREQSANYTALMQQAKAEYLAKKAEYNGYKKQFNSIQKQIKNVEASKKKIQLNVNNVSAPQN